MNKNIIKELKDAMKFVGVKSSSETDIELCYYFKYNTALKSVVTNQYKLSDEFIKEFDINVNKNSNILYFTNLQKLMEVLKDRNYYIDDKGYVYGYLNNFYTKRDNMKLNKEYHYTKFKLIDIMISSQPVSQKTEQIKFHVSKIIQRFEFFGEIKKIGFIASSFSFVF